MRELVDDRHRTRRGECFRVTRQRENGTGEKLVAERGGRLNRRERGILSEEQFTVIRQGSTKASCGNRVGNENLRVPRILQHGKRIRTVQSLTRPDNEFVGRNSAEGGNCARLKITISRCRQRPQVGVSVGEQEGIQLENAVEPRGHRSGNCGPELIDAFNDSRIESNGEVVYPRRRGQERPLTRWCGGRLHLTRGEKQTVARIRDNGDNQGDFDGARG